MNLRNRLDLYDQINHCFDMLDMAKQWNKCKHPANQNISLGYIKIIEKDIRKIEKKIKNDNTDYTKELELRSELRNIIMDIYNIE